MALNKEARETHYWLRLVVGAELLPWTLIADLLNESDQLARILGAIVSRGKKKSKQAKRATQPQA